MKVAHLVMVTLLAGSALAATHSWNAADAYGAAERDYQAGHVQFYWCGTIGVSAPGVPMSLSLRYPQLDGGEGCRVQDRAFRDRQVDYSARYNKRMLALLNHSR